MAASLEEGICPEHPSRPTVMPRTSVCSQLFIEKLLKGTWP
jgi:hypothetical protein